LEHVGISEYIGYVGCYDLDNNGSLETKYKLLSVKVFTIPAERSYKKRPEEAKESQLTHGNRQSQSRKEPKLSSKKPAA
jgi:hypothetical protein